MMENLQRLETEQLFIQKLIEVIPYIGINQQTILESEKLLNLPEGYNKILFPEGWRQIISVIESYFDQLMLEELIVREKYPQIHKNVVAALQLRIKLVPQNLAKKMALFYSIPSNSLLLSSLAWSSCDKIWCYANDQSDDFNYYSKRGMLMSAYVTSMAYYLQDSSLNYCNTDQFVIKIIKRILSFAKIKQKIQLPKLEDIPFIRLFSINNY